MVQSLTADTKCLLITMDLCNRCKQISLDDLVSGIGIFHAETLKIVSKRPCALCRLIWESSNIGCQMGEIFLQLRHRAGYSPLIGVEIRCDRPDCLELESRHSFEVDAHLFAVEGMSTALAFSQFTNNF